MATQALTLERVQRLFSYDAATGKLYWNNRPREDFKSDRTWRGFNTRCAGKEVGAQMPRGHLRVRFERRHLLIHRIIWFMVHGEWPEQVDHIDGDPANNRLENLREANYLINSRNAARRSDNTSGVTGVSRASKVNRWVATISDGERVIHLGQYKTLDEAVAARVAAEKVLGYHPNHGRQGA